MKANKTLKMLLVTLIIVLIAIISFMGVYIKDKNKYANKVKNYQLGMDLSGSRKVTLKVSDEEKEDEEEPVEENATEDELEETENTEEASNTEIENTAEEETKEVKENKLTAKNYKLTKKILEKRLKMMGVNNYEIRLNEENGEMVLNIPENNNTDNVVGQLQYQGKFEIIDKDTEEVLMTNDDIDYVKAGYGSSGNSNSTVIFLNIQFNKAGTEKFKDITNTYIETTVEKNETEEEVADENTENTNAIESQEVQSEDTEAAEEEKTTEPETVTKEITLKIDGSTLFSTHFDKEIANGLLQLSVGSTSSSSTVEELQENLTSANNLAALLNNGKYPLKYTTAQNQYVASEITNENIAFFVCLCIVCALLGMIYIVIRYKDVNGVFAPIYLIAYIAILLLIIRYTNVIVTVNGLIAILLSIALSFVTMINRLKNYEKLDSKKEAYKKSMKETLLMLIPVFIIAVIFTFNSFLPISSFGMVLFWGAVIDLIYMI